MCCENNNRTRKGVTRQNFDPSKPHPCCAKEERQVFLQPLSVLYQATAGIFVRFALAVRKLGSRLDYEPTCGNLENFPVSELIGCRLSPKLP
jgi:hypothetical protein